jgi:3-methyladenine DNA glycosylase AlkD
MNKTDAMNALKAAGSESALKTSTRHGITGPAFGVRYADLYKLVRQIGTDHALALQLWKTGNHDAMILATMIADPVAMKAGELDAWVKTVNNQLMLDAVAALVNRTTHALRCAHRWIDAKAEWTAACGWHVIAGGCCGRPGEPAGAIAQQDASAFETYLQRIEDEIHTSPNRVRHSMNGALIGISQYSPDLCTKALAVAQRIGTVEVDHGDTACKTPDAAAYIRKMAARQSKKKTTKKTAAGAKKKTTRKKAASSR